MKKHSTNSYAADSLGCNTGNALHFLQEDAQGKTMQTYACLDYKFPL